MKAMQKFAEKYCELTDTFFCSDLEITATVIKGEWVSEGVLFFLPGVVVSGVASTRRFRGR
jgi:hypothetical protein